MNIRMESNGEALLVALDGRLDGTTMQLVEAAFLKQAADGATRFVFDMSDLEYISSAGLRVMLLAAKKTRASGGKLALFGLSDSVRDVFEISGFHTIFALLGTKEEAVAFVTA